MKRLLILGIMAGLMSAGAPELIAQVSTNSASANVTPSSGAKRGQDRRQLLKILGLSPKELKGLSQEERRAKVKEATEQKISQLQAKKTAGTITPEEQTDLAFLEKYQHRGKKKASNDS